MTTARDPFCGAFTEAGQPDVDVAPPTFTTPDADGNPVAPFKVVDHCFADTNHEWDGSHEQYADGAMSGFILTNENHGTPPPHPTPGSTSGLRAMQYYGQTELPFYYWLANEFAIGDRYFCSLLGPTWPNRMYLYAASSRGMTDNKLVGFLDTHDGACSTDEDCGLDAPVGTCDNSTSTCAPIGRTIFDYLEQRKIDWKVYSEGTPGWLMTFDAWTLYQGEHEKTLDDYYADAAAGTLPQVAFIDSLIGNEVYDGNDEHPPGTPFLGEAFVANVVDALAKSPNWQSSALFVTYDEHGGLYDHVPPPEACPPGDFQPELPPGGFQADFDRYGVRVPLFVVPPFAKKHYVSHRTYDHTSIMRFIQARFVLPAITNRDANAEAPWDMFDFSAAPHAPPPAIADSDRESGGDRRVRVDLGGVALARSSFRRWHAERCRPTTSVRVPGDREPPVEIECGADEREVRERLREVPEVLSLGAELFAVEADVVRVPEHLFEEEARLVQVPHPRQTLDVPERAHRERPLARRQAVGEVLPHGVAVHERVRDELSLDRAQRGEPPRIGRGDEAHERHEQSGRVDRLAPGGLEERAPTRVPEPSEDIPVNGVANPMPSRDRCRERAAHREPHRTVDRHPAEDPRVQELAPPASALPDALVRPLPVVTYPIHQTANVSPEVE